MHLLEEGHLFSAEEAEGAHILELSSRFDREVGAHELDLMNFLLKRLLFLHSLLILAVVLIISLLS